MVVSNGFDFEPHLSTRSVAATVVSSGYVKFFCRPIVKLEP